MVTQRVVSPAIVVDVALDQRRQLRFLALHLCRTLGLSPDAVLQSRLFRDGERTADGPLDASLARFAEIPLDRSEEERLRLAAHHLGHALDFLSARARHPGRRATGSYFTPRAIAEALIGRTLESSSGHLAESTPSVCDPSCGGGAFLIEAAAQLAQSFGGGARARARVVAGIYGVDLSELAVHIAELSLWFMVGDEAAPVSHPDRFVCGDALLGAVCEDMPVESAALERAEGKLDPVHFFRAFPHLFSGHAPPGFDWVVGNPPWVAFQGRATQKISPERRAFYRRHFRAFQGYPTLHGLFVQRAAQLAPRGTVSVLLPSSVSDLEGYRATRAALERTHEPRLPLPEYGQDAFEGVVQPCFGLIAIPRERAQCAELPDNGPWVLEERTHASAKLREVPVPRVLSRIDDMPTLPPETFREVGFQSNRRVAQTLFLRGDEPRAPFSVPLLEGKNVSEFSVRAPRLFLHADPRVLDETRCRLKPEDAYRAVDVVVRQTAAFTIAAKHDGSRFRNSLLGAFATELVDAELLVGLLNSALYRALHVSRQRDARQAVFPQVKVGHLRRLPLPPVNDECTRVIRELSRRATEMGGLSKDARASLDAAVYRLFSVTGEDAREIHAFLMERAPGALRTNDSLT